MSNKRDERTKNWRTITLRIDPQTHEDLRMLARKDRRSMGNLANKILDEWCEEAKGSVPRSCNNCNRIFTGLAGSRCPNCKSTESIELKGVRQVIENWVEEKKGGEENE